MASDHICYPIHIDTLARQNIRKVIAGGFSAAITAKHQILVWGSGEFGSFKTPQKIYMNNVEF